MSADNRATHRDTPLDANLSGSFLPPLCTPQALLFLVLLSAMLALLLGLLSAGLGRFDWLLFARAGLLILWVVLASAACLCWWRRCSQGLSLRVVAAGSFCIVLLLTAVLSVAAQYLFSPRIDLAISLAHIGVAAILAGVGLRYMYLSQQLRLRAQGELQARLQALEAKVNPHFLFNSLNSIAALTAIDASKAERALEDLSAVMRASLSTAGGQHSWAEEQYLCECYLRIEKARLGDRLQLHWQLAELPSSQLVPAMAVQVLVENAVVHGLQHLLDGGEISISAELDGAVCRWLLRNPVAADGDTVVSQGSGQALENLRHRIAALYGDAASLRCRQEQGVFEACLELPVTEIAPGAEK